MNFHWGWRIGIVYTVFAAATVGMVIFTMTQRVELVADDYYERALNHDATNAAQHAATDAGAEVSYEPDSKQIVFATGTSRATQPGTLSLYRPSDDLLDRTLTWAVDSSGTQRIDASNLRPGRWHVVADWKDATSTYHVELPVDVSH
jgi:hypothetical protein